LEIKVRKFIKMYEDVEKDLERKKEGIKKEFVESV